MKKNYRWHAFGCSQIRLIHIWKDDRYWLWYDCTLHFDTRSLDLRTHKCKKAKASAPIISQSCQLIWMEFGILLRLLYLISRILILLWLINIQGREPYLCDSIDKKLYNGLFIRTCTDQFLANLVWCALHFAISLDNLDLHSKSQLYEKSKNLQCPFSGKSRYWIKLKQYIATTDLLKLMLDFCFLVFFLREWTLLTLFHKISV